VLAHRAEDAALRVEDFGGIEFGDLALVHHADTIIRDDRVQAVFFWLPHSAAVRAIISRGQGRAGQGWAKCFELKNIYIERRTAGRTGDAQDGAVVELGRDGLLDPAVRLVVDGRGGLVQDEDPAVPDERARKAHERTLADGQVCALLVDGAVERKAQSGVSVPFRSVLTFAAIDDDLGGGLHGSLLVEGQAAFEGFAEM
jgi:hypothetical protein